MERADVAIVGAGPYGLSLAAYLRAAGIDYRIFGKPMRFWREHVPPDMLLKSPSDGTNLIDPDSSFPIADHYSELRRPYNYEVPIPVDVFIDYGCTFQKRFVPNVDERNVTSIARTANGFQVQLDDGESLSVGRVIVAIGTRAFTYIPDVLATLPPELVSHSVEYGEIDALRGRKVAVVGSGASAIDLAVALCDRGIDTSIISRRPKIPFGPPPESPPRPRRFYERLRCPGSPVGLGWSNWFYVNAPQLFHLLPEGKRFQLVATALGPQPAWHMAKRVLGRIPIISNCRLERTEIKNGKVQLSLAASDGARKEFVADHVIAATGFRVNTERLEFLSRGLKDEIRTANGAPVLSSNFESSIKGMYFVGAASAPSFGPSMRFVVGAGFTTPRVAAAFRNLGRGS